MAYQVVIRRKRSQKVYPGEGAMPASDNPRAGIGIAREYFVIHGVVCNRVQNARQRTSRYRFSP
ncbi:MAG TPA: hypothetical protein VMM15_36605 [Bradyrhizobium sp.]|nr:hypothetical protein [Bradyrhizobium sp.]